MYKKNDTGTEWYLILRNRSNCAPTNCCLYVRSFLMTLSNGSIKAERWQEIGSIASYPGAVRFDTNTKETSGPFLLSLVINN